ncbi:MAG: hypothetical protein QOF59_1409 [Actinomycetota bacterium]|jgi:hypothetical protein|nr:hypothetical protein [Actinomycetota bacterium]
MIEIQKHESQHRQDLLYAVGLCLIVAVVLVIVAAVLRATSQPYSGLSARNQIELVSRAGAGLEVSALLLGAVVALSFLPAERSESARPLVVIALIVGTIVALLATYSVVDVLTVHVPSANSSDAFTITNTEGAFASRLSGALPQIGSVFVAIVALVGANRFGNGD